MKLEDLGKCAENAPFLKKIIFFQILLNQNLSLFSIDNVFPEVLEGVEGCFRSVNGIFKKSSTMFYQRFLAHRNSQEEKDLKYVSGHAKFSNILSE